MAVMGVRDDNITNQYIQAWKEQCEGFCCDVTSRCTFGVLVKQEPVTPDFTTPVDVASIKISRPSKDPQR